MPSLTQGIKNREINGLWEKLTSELLPPTVQPSLLRTLQLIGLFLLSPFFRLKHKLMSHWQETEFFLFVCVPMHTGREVLKMEALRYLPKRLKHPLGSDPIKPC